MAIVISGVNNNDKITASDGTIDLLSGVNYAGIITAPAFTTTGNLTAGHLNIGSGIQLGNAGVATATTFVGNLNGNVNGSAGTLLLQISGSEKFRVASSGQLGIGGANYGSSGQVLTSAGSGSAPTWSTVSVGGGTGIDFNDNVKIRFGTGNDLEIYHTGSGAAILNAAGSGQLTIGSDNALNLTSRTGTEYYFRAYPNNRAELYYDYSTHNTPKLQTSATGVTVTGTVAATAFTGDGSALTGTGVGTADSINTSGIVTATAFVPTSQGALSHRNIIINGAMIISQRGTSVATSGYQTCDRWQFGGSWPGSAITQSQADVGYNSTPYDQGFRKSYKLTNSNQGSTSAGDNIEITYSFEGQEIATSGWDYVSSSKKITLSFWVKSSVAQTFYGYFRTFPGVDMKYSFPIVCSTTGWEYKTVSIVGESNFAENVQNSFPNTTSRAMVLRIVPYYGTSYTDAGSVSNAWQNYSSGVITPVYDTSWFLTNGATFELTGVQLEVGPVATPFEHRSHGEELRRCKRYYQKDLSRNRRFWGSGNVSGRQFPVRFDVEMRDTPSVSFPSTSIDSGSLSANGINRQGYYTNMSGSGRFYEWQHIADAEM